MILLAASIPDNVRIVRYQEKFQANSSNWLVCDRFCRLQHGQQMVCNVLSTRPLFSAFSSMLIYNPARMSHLPGPVLLFIRCLYQGSSSTSSMAAATTFFPSCVFDKASGILWLSHFLFTIPSGSFKYSNRIRLLWLVITVNLVLSMYGRNFSMDQSTARNPFSVTVKLCEHAADKYFKIHGPDRQTTTSMSSNVLPSWLDRVG